MADQEELGDNLFEMAKSNGLNIAFLCAKTTGVFDFIPRQRPTADTIILGDQRSYSMVSKCISDLTSTKIDLDGAEGIP